MLFDFDLLAKTPTKRSRISIYGSTFETTSSKVSPTTKARTKSFTTRCWLWSTSVTCTPVRLTVSPCVRMVRIAKKGFDAWKREYIAFSE